jgi:hypothetical protein
MLRVLSASVWTQGIRSNYRFAYWRFLSRMAWNWWREPAKLWLGFTVLLSAHHFVLYAREVADELERECQGVPCEEPALVGDLAATVVAAPALP